MVRLTLPLVIVLSLFYQQVFGASVAGSEYKREVTNINPNDGINTDTIHISNINPELSPNPVGEVESDELDKSFGNDQVSNLKGDSGAIRHSDEPVNSENKISVDSKTDLMPSLKGEDNKDRFDVESESKLKSNIDLDSDLPSQGLDDLPEQHEVEAITDPNAFLDNDNKKTSLSNKDGADGDVEMPGIDDLTPLGDDSGQSQSPETPPLSMKNLNIDDIDAGNDDLTTPEKDFNLDQDSTNVEIDSDETPPEDDPDEKIVDENLANDENNSPKTPLSSHVNDLRLDSGSNKDKFTTTEVVSLATLKSTASLLDSANEAGINDKNLSDTVDDLRLDSGSIRGKFTGEGNNVASTNTTTIEAVSPVTLKSTTSLLDSDNEAEMNDKKLNDTGNDEESDTDIELENNDDKTIVLTTRSTTDNFQNVRTTSNQQQQQKQEYLNKMSSTRQPISPYYTQSTGANRFPLSQFSTHRDNVAPGAWRHTSGSPASPYSTPNTITGANNLPNMDNMSGNMNTPLDTTTLEKDSNLKTTTNTDTDLQEDISAKIPENTESLGSTLKSTDVDKESTAQSSTAAEDELTTMEPKEETSTKLDTFEISTTTQETKATIHPKDEISTSQTIAETTVGISTTEKKSDHKNRKRPPVVLKGREGETVASTDNEIVEIKEEKVTSQAISTTTIETVEMSTSNQTEEESGNNVLKAVQKYGHDMVKQYGAFKVSLVLLTIVFVLCIALFCCCKLCKGKRYKARQRRLREFGQEKEFLLRDRKKSDRYANDALTLLDGSSEEEF